MNADRLLALYEKVAEAPDAVPRLRRFVLDLAVRGKLVPQDASDEPASELLKRIAEEKARLVKAGEIKKPKSTEPIDLSELPISVPSHWVWTRLRDIGTLSGGMTPSKNQPDYWDGDVVWLSPKDIKSDEVSDSELKITKQGLSETRLELFPEGSLFIVARSGILKRTFPVSINRVPAASNQDLKVLVPYLKGQERYLQIMFRGMTDFLLTHLVKQGTTVQSLKYAEFEVQPFPLPPLAEQQRIVGSVEELMALLDRLEAARTAREATRDRLTAASLARLTAPDTEASSGKVGTGSPSDDATNKNPPEAEPGVSLRTGTDSASGSATGQAVSGKVDTGFPSDTAQRENSFPANARFALATLPALTTRPGQIKPLRQTILNLAVRGKLVEQDPTDEPASALLKRIAVEKERLRIEKEIRAQKPAPPAETFEAEATIPKTWEHVYLQDIAYQITDGTHLTPKYTESGCPFLSAQNVKPFRFMPDIHRFVSQEDFEKYRSNRRPERGDVLLTRVGAGIGEAAVLDSDFEFAFYVSLCLIKVPNDLVNVDYLVIWLNSPEGRESSTVRTYGKGASQGNLNLGLIRTFKIPLPPLAEQHRIVAKVDALMALCDRLEAALTTADTTRARLLEALLHEALASAADPITEAAE